MTDSTPVTLDLATEEEIPLLANLMQLYVHDLSDMFALDVGADGRFGYPELPLYWSEPDRHFPFLIRYGARVAGFVLVRRGSSDSDDPEGLDLTEFFVLRRYRRHGLGRRAAFLLWDRFPGRWMVRVSEGNLGALPFWAGAIGDYTGGAVSEASRAGSPHDWRVFSFASAGRHV